MNKGFAIYEFTFGFLYIGYEGNKVIKMHKTDENSPDSRKTDFTDRVYSQIMEYLEGRRKTFDIPFELRGTEFQKKVWEQLIKIPYGETRSYKEIAEAIGNPRACRAVGMANNKNPIFIIVPCHRVIGSDGKMVGYAGGLNMKKALLNLEKGSTT